MTWIAPTDTPPALRLENPGKGPGRLFYRRDKCLGRNNKFTFLCKALGRFPWKGTYFLGKEDKLREGRKFMRKPHTGKAPQEGISRLGHGVLYTCVSTGLFFN
jgi:hypothetical protein